MHTTTTWLDVSVAMFALIACVWFGYTLGRAIEKAQRTGEWAELRHAELVADRAGQRRTERLEGEQLRLMLSDEARAYGQREQRQP